MWYSHIDKSHPDSLCKEQVMFHFNVYTKKTSSRSQLFWFFLKGSGPVLLSPCVWVCVLKISGPVEHELY